MGSEWRIEGDTLKIIKCKPGQSAMNAAAEVGLTIHPDSPTPGLSLDGLRAWAAGRAIQVRAIISVRWGECFAAVAPSCAAAAILGRKGGQAGTGASKRRGDADHYRAIRRRDYVADRRQYLSDGRLNRTSGGWLVVRWDESRRIYVETSYYYPTKRAAQDALRRG